MNCFLASLALLFALAFSVARAEDIHVLYAEQRVERPPVLSGLRPIPDDLGLQGAVRGIAENNTTGKMLKQVFILDRVVAEVGERLEDKIKPLLADHQRIIVNAPAETLLHIADLPDAKNALIFNVGAFEDQLRDKDCRGNVLHILPSTNMLTDGLVQFLVKKRWQKVALVTGDKSNDRDFATDLQASATKFGAVIVSTREFGGDSDLRESAADEVPLLTQDADYDVVAVADANDDFGSQIAYNTYYPRPVVGTHGLVPQAWSEVIEPWGAVQLQNAFQKQAGRGMRAIDFAAYSAVRGLGEAATRAKSGDVALLWKTLLADDFQMQAYAGRGLSFREWNGQLRQPIHLVTKEAQVAVAPMEGFLHEDNELDSLGTDRQESQCKNFKH